MENLEKILAKGREVWSAENVAKRQAELETRWRAEAEKQAMQRRQALKLRRTTADTLRGSQNVEKIKSRIIDHVQKSEASESEATASRRADTERRRMIILDGGSERAKLYKLYLQAVAQLKFDEAHGINYDLTGVAF